MRLLFIGDIVGPPGVDLVGRILPALRKQEGLDLVVANAENACNGAGLTPSLFRKLRHAGVDAMTLGDHIYKRQEIIPILEDPEAPICKPANFPPTAPGRTWVEHTTAAGETWTIISVLGRLYMRAVDCPFSALDRVLDAVGPKTLVVVDVHAEATADKLLLGRYLAGRAVAVVGTHTHVPTADEQILPGGTAYITDAGMTGPHDGILGRCYEPVLFANRHFVPRSFDVSNGPARLHGVVIDVDPANRKATGIRRIVAE